MSCEELREQLKEAVNKNDTVAVERIIQEHVELGDDCDIPPCIWVKVCEVALKNRCLPMVKLLLSSKSIADHFVDIETNIQLMKTAIKSDFAEGIKFLHFKGVPLYLSASISHYSWHAIIECVQNNKIEVLTYLLDITDLDKNPDKDETLLMLCCRQLHVESLEILLKSELKNTINQQTGDRQYSALHYCIGPWRKKEVLDCVQLLVEAGADVNLWDIDWETPIQKAAERGMVAVVIFLAKRGANLDIRNNKGTLIHCLAAEANEMSGYYDECVQLLITKGIDINELNSFNETPLHLAVCEGNEEMVKTLIKSHCDVNIKAGNNMGSVLLAPIGRHRDTITQILINAGCDVNIADKYGVTPLLESVQWYQTTITEILIKAGCDVNIPDINGVTPLLASVTVQDATMNQILIQFGCNVYNADKDGVAPLVEAIRKQDATMAQAPIKAGCDVSPADKNGVISLLESVKRRKTTAAEMLIKAGCDVNSTDKDGATALMQCVQASNVVLVKQLIDHGASVNAKDNKGCFVLDYLFLAYHHTNDQSTSADIVKMMIEAGADIHKCNNLLCRAITGEHYKMALLLIEHGIDINTVDENGDKPLARSAEKGELELMKILASHDCDINHQNLKGETALHKVPQISRHFANFQNMSGYSANYQDKTKVINTLLQNGMNVNLSDVDGQTALFIAVGNGDASITVQLLKAGADVNHCNTRGETPMMFALINTCSLYKKVMVDVLLKAGAELKPRDRLGRNAIFLATLLDGSQELDILLKYSNLRGEAESIVNATDKDGKTSLMVAAERGPKDMVEKLLRVGCNINLQDHRGKTALMYAVDNQDETILSLLLQNGADYNICDNNGQTALMVAVENHKKIHCEYLLKAGADVNLRDNNGKTVLMAAARICNRSILECLLNAGADVDETDIDGRSAIHYIMVGDSYCHYPIMVGGDMDRKWINCLKLLLINKCHMSLDIPGKNRKTLFQWLLKKHEEDLIWYLVTENCSLRDLDLSKVKDKFQFPDMLILSKILFESGAPKSEIEKMISMSVLNTRLSLSTYNPVLPVINSGLSLFTYGPMHSETENKHPLDEFREFCKSRSLMSRCRREIRKCIGPGISSKIDLPQCIEDYVVMKDLIPKKYFTLVINDKDDEEDDHYDHYVEDDHYGHYDEDDH
ncbi:serine/threonine-protein phosphatase 6 regulatory ankyrin repeat subunit C-like [Patella vulgata]|uniref:serine/threonine-protein phosphatase 6 regulatory ankyrin repeat subunit C-like n=1 Tax=Patella vulgata TaxID=6465 RepID=UPI0024A8025D|nr:serine/threonine-protein phosphatase 6 regulatory ankyrin repeat subunit C-like [Patella vulgata]